MPPKQTSSDSLHPPVIAGASTGGESRGIFNAMKTTKETPPEGTLDWYRELGNTDPNIAALVGMIDRMKVQWTSAIEAMIAARGKLAEIQKLISGKDGE